MTLTAMKSVIFYNILYIRYTYLLIIFLNIYLPTIKMKMITHQYRKTVLKVLKNKKLYNYYKNTHMLQRFTFI